MPDARRWLRLFFLPPARAGILPAEICRWLASESGKAALVVKRNGARLFVRRYRPHPVDSIALMLERIGEKEAESFRTHTALTRRENEVLGWVAAGKPDRDIAEILDVSPKTVGKHIERILAKLGVDNRTSATSLYLKPAGRTL